jgi:L-2-hydroxyglutarate oxidase LhgO
LTPAVVRTKESGEREGIMDETQYDVAVIGGGIVGLATAIALAQRFARLRIVVLEKEGAVARHQTGHNSGVIHAGIYYKPGSYKAQLCVDGVRHMREFCDRRGIPYEECGKVVLATCDDEVGRLEELYRRGVANGVPGLAMLSPEQLRDVEPHARAVRALHSAHTAIVDFGRVARVMAEDLARGGVTIRLSSPVVAVDHRAEGVFLETPLGTVRTRAVVNCAGLYADRVARLMNARPTVRIIPFRGEYYTLRREQSVVRALVYPVPDPRFPFLGVHFTKRITGEMEAGPNAVLAFAREGYRMRDVNLGELADVMGFVGFWRMGGRYWRMGAEEFWRSLSKRAFWNGLRRLVPDIEEDDLLPGGSGVRAQAVAADGSLVDDFSIVQSPGAIHVLNAPSPGATASFAIGRHIAALAATGLEVCAGA